MNSIIEQAKQTFETWGIECAICGGMAIDIFLGEETRKHYDLDLFVFWSDKRKIIELMLNDDWRVFEACGNGVVPLRVSRDKNIDPLRVANLAAFLFYRYKFLSGVEDKNLYRLP